MNDTTVNVTLTTDQLDELLDEKTIQVIDDDGDEVTLVGADMPQLQLQMIADGFPEQINLEDFDLEIEIED